jgi:hypothetical protein
MCNVHNKRVFYLLGFVDNCNKNVKKLFPSNLDGSLSAGE